MMVHVASVVLFIGVVLIVLASFGINFGPFDLFEFGVALCFAAGFGHYYLGHTHA